MNLCVGLVVVEKFIARRGNTEIYLISPVRAMVHSGTRM